MCVFENNRGFYLGMLVQERRNFIANALELRLSWTNPSIWQFVLGLADIKLSVSPYQRPTWLTMVNGIPLYPESQWKITGKQHTSGAYACYCVRVGIQYGYWNYTYTWFH